MDTQNKLSRLYSMEDRLGDKLANMEMRNHDGLTGLEYAAWLADYQALESRIVAVQAEIDALQKH